MNKVAVIDDQEKHLLNWKLCLQAELEVFTFFHHQQCFEFYRKNPEELKDLIYIISDRFVPQYDAIKQDFALNFKEEFSAFKGDILLSSSAHESHEFIGRGFLCSIGKKAMSLTELKQLLSNKG